MTYDEVQQKWPGYLKKRMLPPSYETDDMVLPRVFLALDNVRKKHPGETVALVCHAGIIYAVEAYLKAQVDRLHKHPSIPAHTGGDARLDPHRYGISPHTPLESSLDTVSTTRSILLQFSMSIICFLVSLSLAASLQEHHAHVFACLPLFLLQSGYKNPTRRYRIGNLGCRWIKWDGSKFKLGKRVSLLASEGLYGSSKAGGGKKASSDVTN